MLELPPNYDDVGYLKAALNGLVGTQWKCDRIGGIANILLDNDKMQPYDLEQDN
jgi:hypothetical protein